MHNDILYILYILYISHTLLSYPLKVSFMFIHSDMVNLPFTLQ
jgi:hypothetical protein